VKIVIVGGVAAGASTAARARRLDEHAEIVLLERGQHVSFANCGLPYHVGGVIEDRELLLLQTPESLKAALDLDVRVGHEVKSIDRQSKRVRINETATGREYEESYDKLALCPGARPIRPRIPGIDHSRVFVLRDIDDMDAIKAIVDAGAKNAVVIGGGYIGVEMSENLRHRDLSVDVVEMQDQIMAPLDHEMARELQNHLRWHSVRVHLGVAAAAFRDADGQVLVELSDGKTLKTDLVLLSVGVQPESSLARESGLELGPRGGIKVDEHLCTSDPDIYAAGDAVEVRHTVTGEECLIPLAGPANRQGRIVADNIFGRDSTYTTTQGTAIVKVFDMTAGATGAVEKTLKPAGTAYEKVYLHPSGHAGYYPGTAPMHIKLTFAPGTGKILGAQIVGYDGVDKRLDAFAIAIRAGMTVFDLQDLELSYAPPFGSAKDPINMAGFLAANLLKGDIECWYPEDYPDKTSEGILLDVRSPEEYAAWHIPGAINIPLGSLRGSLDQLPQGKPIFAYCKVGFRSYLAYRLLKQRGYTRARSLCGGTSTFCPYHGSSVCTGQPEPPLLAYAEEKMTLRTPAPTGKRVEINCTGMQCPGPIRKLAEAMQQASPGDELLVTASDPGFATDAPAWCRKQGHEVLSITPVPNGYQALIRKATATRVADSPAAPTRDKKTMVVFSGDLDKVMASFVIANGAAAMGSEVTMFFTFWGLNALRKPDAPPIRKPLLDQMFGWMMPKGARALKLSKLNMLGMGTAMMKHVMQQKNVDSLPQLIDSARQAGVKLVACAMSMDVMGLKREELIDGIEVGGVATFLGESDEAGMTLFI